MPVLDGERLVARVDPRFDRRRRMLEIRAVHWEPRVRPAPAVKRRLHDAIERLAAFIGASSVALLNA
jgi:uncharacterized protein YcaQ